MKLSPLKVTIIGIIVLGIIGGARLWASKGDSAATSNPTTSSISVGNNHGELPRAGDVIAGLKVLSVSRISEEEYELRFLGETKVEGKYYEVSYDGVTTGLLCFEVSEKSADRIPRLAGDARRPWFCFDRLGPTMRKELERSADKVEGAAVVVISNYVLRYGAKEIADEARLVSVEN